MEFDVYVNYAKDILSSKFKNTLDGLLNRPDVSDACRIAGSGYKIAVKYYLPMLLQGPIYHCFHYRKYIEVRIYPRQKKGKLQQKTILFQKIKFKQY